MSQSHKMLAAMMPYLDFFILLERYIFYYLNVLIFLENFLILKKTYLLSSLLLALHTIILYSLSSSALLMKR